MLQTIANLMQEIRRDLATLPELKQCHFDVPDAINRTPAVVVYPSAGNWRLGTHMGDGGRGKRVAMHTIRIELHVARVDLARSVETAMFFCDVLPDWIFAGFKRDAFNGTMVVPGDPRTANNSTAPIRYQFLELPWGSDQNLGWRLEFDVTCEAEINV